MQFITDHCVLLDTRQLAAEGYKHHVRIMPETVAQAPYQAGSAAGEAVDDMPHIIDDGEEAAAGQQGPKRKRKRRSKYEPNTAELEAQERADKVVPLLQSALDALRQWMEASGTSSLLQLHQQNKATQAPAGSNDEGKAPSNHVQPPLGQEGLAVASGGQQRGHEAARKALSGYGGIVGAVAATGDPDYIALAALRHALHPKFEWVAATELEGQGPLQPLPGGQARCNLFGQLIRNKGPQEAVGLAGGNEVVIPPGAAYLMSDVRQLQPLVQEASSEGGYHCIVADPPWENKSAARGAKYPTLPSRNLLALPLPSLLGIGSGSSGGSGSCAASMEVEAACSGSSSIREKSADGPGCSSWGTAGWAGLSSGQLVVLWVTNRERHRRFVEQELLPAWGLRHVATWYWLKVTAGGEPVGRLDIAHRRPYEPILLCRPASVPAAAPGMPRSGRKTASAEHYSSGAAAMVHEEQPPLQPPWEQAASGARAAWGEIDAEGEIPDGLVLLSVPAQHSRKPHLGPLLRPFLPPQARCLEMFARELFPGWTSWGNEVLKFQGLGEHFLRHSSTLPC